MKGFEDSSSQYRSKNKASSVNLGNNHNSMNIESEHTHRYKMH